MTGKDGRDEGFCQSRRTFLQTGTAAVAGSLLSGRAQAEEHSPAQGRKPNIIFIFGEGHRADYLSIAGHPFLKTPNHDRIGREGVRFTNAFCTNALCAPARSVALTGMYSKSSGALANGGLDKPLDVPYFTDMLQEAGYEIALVGKAHCHMGARDRKWDYYFGFNAAVTNFYKPKFIEGRKGVMGEQQTYEGFADDVALEKALAWLAEPREKPFCLLFWPQTPHSPFFRARRHLDLYRKTEIEKPSTFDDDLKGYPGKPRCVAQATCTIGTNDNVDAVRSLEELVKDYCAGLVAVDEMIGKLFSHVESKNVLDHTAFVHSSDHGFFLGEYRFYDKRLMYEPSIRVPLMIRYPKMAPAGTVRNEMVLDVDLAPTILELAGVEPRKEMQGRSVMGLARGRNQGWRKEWLYEYYEDPSWTKIRANRGVRTETHKLIHYYPVDEWEMYDVSKDPEEKNNLYGKPEHAQLQTELKAALTRLSAEIPTHHA